MSSARLCLKRLAAGPATAAELADCCADSSGAVARTMNGLIGKGLVRRVDGKSGRGFRAVYALVTRGAA